MAPEKYVIVFIQITLLAVLCSSIQVEVEQGWLLGETINFVEDEFIYVNTSVNVFKGIPYAEPPERFRAAEPKKKWDGILNATSFTNSCPQFEVIPTLEVYTYDEDCLYLNVFAPSDVTESVPVMVFIHGGGYTTGTSMTNGVDGRALVSVGNVVVVTINYRLGALGFLDTGDQASTGNFGLLDQAEALRWVQRNIGAFGGDNSSVTIFGESAGSGSVDFHLLSKKSHDLFHQAILESGTAIASWSYREEYEMNKVNAAFQLGALLNCDTSDTFELVDCLRLIDPMVLEQTVSQNVIRMGPTIDGVFLEESPITMTERGDFKDCPLIIGFNKDEGTLYIPFIFPEYARSKDAPYVNQDTYNMLVREALRANNPFVPELLVDSVQQEYVDWSQWDNQTADYFDTLVPILGDETFSCPSLKTARAHATMSSAPVFMYFMTQVPTWSVFELNQTGPGYLGAGHGEDLQFVFGFHFMPEFDEVYGPVPNEEKKLSVDFMRFWTNFASTGDPSRSDDSSSPGNGELEWPAFTVPGLEYKDLSVDLPVGNGIKADECAFWNDYKPQLLTMLASMDQNELEWREEFSSWQDDLEEWRLSFSEYQQNPYCEDL